MVDLGGQRKDGVEKGLINNGMEDHMKSGEKLL